MNKTLVVCSKCGKPNEFEKAKSEGWLVAQRIGQPEGYLIIRCSEHITDHARKLAGLRQEYYHQHKAQPTPGAADGGVGPASNLSKRVIFIRQSGEFSPATANANR